MSIPVEIVFRDLHKSEEAETRIHEGVAKLHHLFDRLMSCRVVIDLPHRHHNHGRVFHVRIEMKVPGTELVISRAPEDDHAHEDMMVAIRDAFESARRELQRHAEKIKG